MREAKRELPSFRAMLAAMTAALDPYLAFCDGSLDFRCSECTAICCRGQGFGGSLRREVGSLLRTYPGLAAVAVGRRGDVVTFSSPTNACFFLDQDLLCRIEKDHGRELKPGVCLLFPFNSLTRIGETIVIRPHFLCPLRLASPPRPGAVEGTFSRVQELAREARLLDEPATIRAEALHPLADARSVLEREIRFRELCTAALGRRAFRDTLEEACGELGRDVFVSRAARLAGLAPTRSGPRDHLDDLLLALAPALRLSMLLLPAEGMIRALELGELALRTTAPLARSPLTLQGAHQILTTIGPALRLLARGDDPLRPDSSARARLPDLGQPDLALAAAVALRAKGGPAGTLERLEQAIPSGMEQADRTALLVQIGIALEDDLRDEIET